MNMQFRSIVETAADMKAAEPGPRPRLWKVLGALALVAAAAAASWWFWRGQAITAARVSRGAAAEIVYATGSVEPET
jgi:hypothetical protein